MSRISQIPAEQWDPRLKAAARPETATALEQGLTRYFAHTPDMALGLMQFAGALKVHRTLPERLVELVRLRIAFFNQCRSCMAIRYTDAVNDGLTEGLVCSLERPEEADDLTRSDLEARGVDGSLTAVDLGDVLDANHEIDAGGETFWMSVGPRVEEGAAGSRAKEPATLFERQSTRLEPGEHSGS